MATLSNIALAGGGPDEGNTPQNKINDVPHGYKLVKVDAECKEKDPCQKEKDEIAKLKKELEQQRKDNTELRKALAEADEPIDCPAPIVKTKEVKIPVDRIVEKPVEKIVTKETVRRDISIGAMVAYSQDGIETEEKNPDGTIKDALTYRSVIGGPYITIPIGDKFEIGAFGMFGGVNQTFGAKVGVSL